MKTLGLFLGDLRPRQFLSVFFIGTLVTGCATSPESPQEAESASARVVSETHVCSAAGALQESIVCSPDGRHVALAVRAGNGWCVEVDGKAGKTFLGIQKEPFQFSPNSQRFGYRANVTKTDMVAVVDGVAGKFYGGLAGPVFSPDSQHAGYVARTENGGVLTIDGKEEEIPDQPAGLSGFTPDGKGLAYALTKNGKQYWIIKEQPLPLHDYVRELVFSPDGQRVAYIAGEGQPLPSPPRWYNPFAGEWRTGELGSREMEKLAQFVVLDGLEGKRYNMAGGLVFSPDGRHVAYKAMSGKKWFVVLDGQEQPQRFDWLADWPLVFSPDGNRLAYVGGRDNRWCVVIDGRIEEWDNIAMNPVFSPDSKRIAYAAIKGTGYFAVVDGQSGIKYDAHRPLFLAENIDMPAMVFSPDSRHIAYCGHDRRGCFAVVDGAEGRGSAWIPGPIVFDSNEQFHYLQIRKNKKSSDIYLVEERVPQAPAPR